jgi:hypothetical protein
VQSAARGRQFQGRRSSRGTSRISGRGRDSDCSLPPAQIPACGFCFAAPSVSRTGLLSKVGRDREETEALCPGPSDPSACGVGDMRSPALCPAHALPQTVPPTGRLPSTLSAPDLSAGVVRGFLGTMQPSDSSCLPGRLRFRSFPTGPGIAMATAGGVRSPRFRRVPFMRDRVFDHGRASAPRKAVRTMLPSTFSTGSAPAVGIFRGSIAHPTRLLCTLRRGRHLPRRNTRYRATRYGLTRTGLSPAGTCQLRLAHRKLTLSIAHNDVRFS